MSRMRGTDRTNHTNIHVKVGRWLGHQFRPQGTTSCRAIRTSAARMKEQTLRMIDLGCAVCLEMAGPARCTGSRRCFSLLLAMVTRGQAKTTTIPAGDGVFLVVKGSSERAEALRWWLTGGARQGPMGNPPGLVLHVTNACGSITLHDCVVSVVSPIQTL